MNSIYNWSSKLQPSHHPCSYVIEIWVLGNQLTLMRCLISSVSWSNDCHLWPSLKAPTSQRASQQEKSQIAQVSLLYLVAATSSLVLPVPCHTSNYILLHSLPYPTLATQHLSHHTRISHSCMPSPAPQIPHQASLSSHCARHSYALAHPLTCLPACSQAALHWQLTADLPTECLLVGSWQKVVRRSSLNYLINLLSDGNGNCWDCHH